MTIFKITASLLLQVPSDHLGMMNKTGGYCNAKGKSGCGINHQSPLIVQNISESI